MRRIRAELAGDRKRHLRSLELLFEVGSTNTRLLAARRRPPARPTSVGRVAARRPRPPGRRWIAPFGGGIAMSVAWTFSDAARALPALSLGVGVAVVAGAGARRARGISLKWPNDIWFEDRKIGGVLIDCAPRRAARPMW